MSYYTRHIFVCSNQKAPGRICCANSGGVSFAEHLKERLKKVNMYGPDKIRVSQSGCLGRCKLGPCLVIYPEGIWYTYQTKEDIDEIIEQYLLEGNIVSRLQIDKAGIF